MGPWVEVYQEKGLNEEIKCKGIRMDMIDENLVSLSNTALLTEKGKAEYLKAGGKPDQADNYQVRFGDAIRFNDPYNPMIGHKEEINRDEKMAKDPKEKIKQTILRQYKQYYHVLETDYNGFLVMYSCFEAHEYRDRNTKQYLSDEQLWETVKNKDVEIDWSLPSTITLKYGDDVEYMELYKQRLQIFMRPLYNENNGRWEYNSEVITDSRINYLVGRYSDYFLDLKMDTQYEILNHDENCNYDPF